MRIIESDERRWDFLAKLIDTEGYKTFVEVGCKEGRTTGFVLDKCRDVVVYAIDPWTAIPNADESYEGWDFEAIERTFWELVGANKHRCRMLKTTSDKAVEQFDDESVGVVFIDAAHDFENVRRDIQLWWPKVKKGGVLCGHDYQHKFPGCMRAVAKSFCLMDVGCGPDSVWFVRKTTGREYEEAA